MDGCQPVWWTVAQVIAIKKSAKMDEQAQRWWMKCVGGPDFFIADEATGKPSYVEKKKKRWPIRTSLVVQWLRL